MQNWLNLTLLSISDKLVDFELDFSILIFLHYSCKIFGRNFVFSDSVQINAKTFLKVYFNVQNKTNLTINFKI